MWAGQLPRDVADLWAFIVGLDETRLLALLAHCASRTVNALRLPWDRKPKALQTADRLASAIGLDIVKDWTPTVNSYLGRVTKAHIVAAVAEGVSQDAANRIVGMKKPDMANAAEQLLAGTGWLPAIMRTTETDGADVAVRLSDTGQPHTEEQDGEGSYAIAAE